LPVLIFTVEYKGVKLPMNMEHEDILQSIYQVIQERKAHPSEKSYTASLMQKGIDKILKKVGEEAAELIIAGKGGVREEIVYEAADLFFHSLLLLGFYDIEPEEVYSELRRRFGVSGLEEKASRERENS
jgi:phosphoribosyl-ATP pyrophosphohydrolase